jgi:hypothetical protein
LVDEISLAIANLAGPHAPHKASRKRVVGQDHPNDEQRHEAVGHWM